MDTASVASQQRIAHDKNIRIAKRVFDPYAETQMASATVNKNFQNPLSLAKNPKRSANPSWAPEIDYRFHPVLVGGYNGGKSVTQNPSIIDGAYTKNIQYSLVDKQHVTAGTALNNNYGTDIVTPKNFAIADAVKFQVGNDAKASAPTPDKFWALNQNLYSPLVLDTQGNRTDATMAQALGNDQTNPTSQYLTQRNQIQVPLPNYDAFTPEANTATYADRFADIKNSNYFPMILGIGIVLGVIFVASGKVNI
tara:strand:- start:4745 stop:5500 length:756 start_codon:yes stop_codon:yes gene_type:complete